MKSCKLILPLLLLALVAGIAADTVADISNAAVLFLRIAPGSRAAGMGEAYVAIANDATATHWNPAGLGTSPLADTWEDANVPAQFQPLSAIAPVHTGSGKGYRAYDFWAISPQGLVRYNHREWATRELFSTKTDDTVEKIVQSYAVIGDGQLLGEVVKRGAVANNKGTYEELVALRDTVLANVPETHREQARLAVDLDSLLIAYDRCQITWDRVRDAQKRLADGLKKGPLSDNDITSISVAIERSRSRWLPEELVIPYSALLPGELTCLAATTDNLLVGTTEGVARFNGKSWQLLGVADGLPAKRVTTMKEVGRSILIGTDAGVAVFNGSTIEKLTPGLAGLPEGRIQVLGGNAMNNLYAVVGNSLLRFDGRLWKTTFGYQAALDDSPERIAEKFSLYGSRAEQAAYLEKYKRVFAPLTVETGETAIAAEPTDSAAAVAAPVVSTGVPGYDVAIRPGEIIEVPLLSEIKGAVNYIHVDSKNQVWLGTEYGVFLFEIPMAFPRVPGAYGRRGETIDSLCVGIKNRSYEQALAWLIGINDLDASGVLTPGQSVRVPANPAAGAINFISGQGDKLLFAAESGLIEYDGQEWSRSDARGMERTGVKLVSTVGDEVWLASDRNLTVRGRGRMDISFMHVNWLPELADDLYYDYLALSTPVRGWGTAGFSITHISYGTFQRTNEGSSVVVGEFDAYDMAFTGSFGTSLTNKLKGGVSAKMIISHLAEQGAGQEQGAGTASGFALDLGLMYLWSQRLTLGLAITNIGPKMAYIDAAQSDDLPRNLAFGFAYKRSNRLQSAVGDSEINKLLVGLGDGVSDELQQTVLNGGAEFTYANLISVRAGYIYDQEGSIKTPTLGAGLRPIDLLQLDFSFIPSQDDFALANTLRVSGRLLF
jgi:hypothetical protein